ncbi:MAG: electron transfer flavoprotein subunit beta/FixA family protein [Chloroflexi bacterium]|nr:electron transfer flavoprotein subunit beta/FixA family protein [Chloroflexota bacterium]
MNIVVCVKQVPDPAAPAGSFSLDRAAKKVVVAPSVPFAVSDYDEYAVEAALRLKEAVAGSKVKVVSLGASHVLEVIKKTVAMGADEIYLIQDAGLAQGDAIATAHTLAAAIKKAGPFDVLMFGRQSADLDQGIVGSGVAAILGIPVVTNAVKIEAKGDKLHVSRLAVVGTETIETPTPVAVTVSSELGQPRYATMRGIMNSRRVTPVVWKAGDLGADGSKVGAAGSLTETVDAYVPQSSTKVELVEGENLADAGHKLAQRLRQARII